MSRIVWLAAQAAIVVVLLSIVLGLAPSAGAQPTLQRFGMPRQDGDYAIPNGHFFTQAAPGQGGAGYRVANEAGIPFWDAFQAEGGVETLGYPLTRRFTWQGTVVQVFQNSALRWLPTERRTEIRPAQDIGDPPSDAKRAELPLAFRGDAQRQPWSGWWWPANDVVGGPRLFDLNGPLARYDRYVEALGKPDPKTMEWERAEIRFSGQSWAGHCNGWAAASLLEPEPVRPRTINGTTFSVADQKGLLTSYHFADAAAWAAGSEEKDVSAAEFHRALTAWLGGQGKGAIFTYRPAGEEVWSYPAYRFETEIGPDLQEADVWHVRTVVWLVDNDVPAEFVGSRPWPAVDGTVLEYTLTGNDPHNPTGGAWSTATDGRFGRPFMLWYPDPTTRNLGRQLTSPNLDYELIREITRGPATEPLFNPQLPPVPALEAAPGLLPSPSPSPLPATAPDSAASPDSHEDIPEASPTPAPSPEADESSTPDEAPTTTATPVPPTPTPAEAQDTSDENASSDDDEAD